MVITTDMVKRLREETGAGVLDCRKVLESCDGDLEKAVALLREKGMAEVAKRAGREALDGRVEAYVHPGDRVAVLLELNCETDFVARTDEFKDLAHNLTLHIAFAAPKYIRRAEVPEAVLERERAEYRAQALDEGKPDDIVDRIVVGRLEKSFESACLLEQPYVRDEDVTIEDLLNDAVAKLGENIIVRRFVRYEVGQSSEEVTSTAA